MSKNYRITVDEQDPFKSSAFTRIVDVALSEEEYSRLKAMVTPISIREIPSRDYHDSSVESVIPLTVGAELVKIIRDLEKEYDCRFSGSLIIGSIRDYFRKLGK